MADRKPLNVINPNDKVEQLRQQFASEGVTPKSGEPQVTASSSPIAEKVIDALRTVFDPEIPLNIYDLGLIYDITIDSEHRVKILMTLTAPGCPVAGQIVADVERKVENVDEVKSCQVELTFEPAWSKDRMSEAALLELGLL